MKNLREALKKDLYLAEMATQLPIKKYEKKFIVSMKDVYNELGGIRKLNTVIIKTVSDLFGSWSQDSIIIKPDHEKLYKIIGGKYVYNALLFTQKIKYFQKA